MAGNKGIFPNGDYPFAPSAPPPLTQHHGMPTYIPDRPPPPSYEESQRNQYPNPFNVINTPAPILAPAQLSMNSGVNPINNGYPQMNQGYSHFPISQAQYSSPVIARNIQQNHAINQQPANKSVPVLQFASGARFSGKGGGSVSVPPPPPGVPPNAAQLAALQGQPVILQKQKKSFF